MEVNEVLQEQRLRALLEERELFTDEVAEEKEEAAA